MKLVPTSRGTYIYKVEYSRTFSRLVIMLRTLTFGIYSYDTTVQILALHKKQVYL